MKISKSIIYTIASACFGIGALNSDAQMQNIQNYSTADDSAKFAEMGLDSSRISKYVALKIRPGEVSRFRDTKRPNALFIFPWSDYDGFFTKDSLNFLFQKARKMYDTKAVIASKDSDVYSAIKSTPNIELLVLSGHSGEGGKHLCFGVPVNDVFLLTQERHGDAMLDSCDRALKKYLDMLNPTATIFIYSCYAANREGNIADFISSMARQKKVIAPINNLHSCSMKINRLYPLDVQFLSEESGKDCTFALKYKQKSN